MAAALLLADARLPTGGHAHSGGLEAALADGVAGLDGVAGFLHGRLHTVASVEAAIAAAAAGAAASGDLPELWTLDAEARARCASPALRVAASSLGRGLLRTALRVWPQDLVLPAYRAGSAHTPRPVVLGVLGAASGLQPEDVARVSLHEDLAGVAAAAVKLMPVDAAGAMALVARLAPEIDRLAAVLALPCPASELPSASAPLLDARSLVHDRQPGRLFAT
jgi:urease accessory protein